MTIDIPTRPVEHTAQPDPRRRGLKGGPQINFGRSPSKQLLVVGGQPRANLLPPEIILKRKQLKTRRALRVGVFFVFVATVVACGLTFGVASVAQVQAGLAQDKQTELLAQQGAYAEVRDVQSTIATVQAGQQVGVSTEIDWKGYLLKLQGVLPAGVKLTGVSIESGTPMEAFQQSEIPLQGARVAALTFTAQSKVIPKIPEWLRGMATLTGFVDATPGTVAFDDDKQLYVSTILMHINSDALSLRFDPAHIAAEEAAAAEAAKHADAQKKTMKPASETSTDGTGTGDSTTDEGGQ